MKALLTVAFVLAMILLAQAFENQAMNDESQLSNPEEIIRARRYGWGGYGGYGMGYGGYGMGGWGYRPWGMWGWGR